MISNNQNALEILEYFENNDLKAQLQAKDTIICKLKEHIKSMRENNKEEKVKHKMDEIETINIKLEHSVAKLLSKNARLHKEIKHLKKIYKDQFDLIKKTCALSKEHCDSLIAQLNSKSMENAALKGQIQEKVFVTTSLQSELRRLKGIKCSTSTYRSQPTCNKKNDRISQKPSSNNKNKVEAQPRKVNKKNRVKEPICDVNVKHTMLNANSQLIYVKCKQCMFDANHDVCFLDFVNNVNLCSKSKSDKKSQHHNIWKPTGKVFTKVVHKWKPIRRLFTIGGNSCPLTRITPTKVVHLKETTSNLGDAQKPDIKVYSRRPKQVKLVGLSKKAKIVESKIANNLKPTHLWRSNATDVPSSSSSLVNDRLSRLFSRVVRFRNDQVAKIMRKNTCFIWNLEGVDLLSGSRDINLYTIYLDDMLKTSPICLLLKASKIKSWLWHRRLSYLNFGTLNKLAKDSLARGIPKLKF
ncbi:retrovirus-related pol polyprotein from transposon TNT 1-94 [Tanacetum coccineum]